MDDWLIALLAWVAVSGVILWCWHQFTVMVEAKERRARRR